MVDSSIVLLLSKSLLRRLMGLNGAQNLAHATGDKEEGLVQASSRLNGRWPIRLGTAMQGLNCNSGGAVFGAGICYVGGLLKSWSCLHDRNLALWLESVSVIVDISEDRLESFKSLVGTST